MNTVTLMDENNMLCVQNMLLLKQFIPAVSRTHTENLFH